jgi:hypothetical protein
MSLRRTAPVVVGLLAAGLVSACKPSIEGKYYNTQSGQLVLELKGGKLIMAGGMDAMNASYTVKGDSILLMDPQNPGGSPATVLVRAKDGSIDAGMLGTLRKK